MNPRPSEYETGVLTTQPQRSVLQFHNADLSFNQIPGLLVLFDKARVAWNEKNM
jgi:hypothetical protein